MKWNRLDVVAKARPVVVLGLLLASAAICSAATETYYYFVFSNPVAGHEDEYNTWYNEQHAEDVVAVPGFVTAQRFVKNDLPLYREADVRLPKYLIVYKVVTENLDAVVAEVFRRLEAKETLLSPAYDRASSISYIYRVFRPEIAGVGGEPEGSNSGPKQTYYQVVFTPFVDGREDEFNAGYDQHHAPELAAIPGFTSAVRMILAKPLSTSIPATKYLALFKVETSDLAAVKVLAARPVTPSPAQDVNATRGYTFRAIGPVIEGDQVRAERSAKSGRTRR